MGNKMKEDVIGKVGGQKPLISGTKEYCKRLDREEIILLYALSETSLDRITNLLG